MKLLIVEDEAKIADYLRKGLAEEGYVIDVAANGIDGLHMASHGNYDLIVLDTMLPGIDGFGLLAALRQSKQTPVIMLTDRHRIEGDVRLGPGSVSTCRPKSFNCCHFYCAAKERCCLALKLQNKFGT